MEGSSEGASSSHPEDQDLNKDIKDLLLVCTEQLTVSIYHFFGPEL